LRVLVQQAGESAAVDEVVARMEPGAERVWRHGCQGCSVTVSAAYGGRTIEYQEAYVDLWSGDEWVAMIKPDGSLAGGHAGVGPRADGTLPSKAVLLTRFARGRPPGRSASLMDDDGRQSN